MVFPTLNSYIGAVVGIKVHLFYFAKQRVSRVGSGALVVEGLLDHVVEFLKEVLFLYSVFFNGFLNAHLCFKLLYGINQAFELFLGRLCL